MLTFSPHHYSPTVAALIDPQAVNELGPGHPDLTVQPALEAMTIETAFAPHNVIDRHMASCCLSALWLHRDFLDQAHTISQSIPTTSGSFWHGIMHRREGDFSNAKYWFRKVGSHPVFQPLADTTRELASGLASGLASSVRASGGMSFLTAGENWDPYEFVDLCQRAIERDADIRGLCQQFQQAEWQLLFDYCYRHAVRAE